jgi:carbohydrate kinase (thermoresistant glucokinase family)
MSDSGVAIREAVALARLQVVVMGVSGSGKSTVGELLARRLNVDYADADDFHSESNKAKLHAGVPLTDADRLPWLYAIRDWLAERDRAVVTCSALKRRYRDLLRRGAPDCVFLFCSGDRALLAERVASRTEHFMSAALLDSQLAELEPPQADERAVTQDVRQPPEAIVESFVMQVVRRSREPDG